MTAQPQTPPAPVMAGLEDIYAEIKQRRRELRPGDRIVQDLDVDSLAAVELLVAVEERFGVGLFGDRDAAEATTIGELAAVIAARTTPGQ